MEPTQGPYTVEHGSKGQIYVFGNDGYSLLCEVNTLPDESETNAALLAASWEMKEALSYAVNTWVQGEPPPQWTWEIMRSALAKATQIT